MASGRRRSHPGARPCSFPGSMVVHLRRQAVVQSFLALGRVRQCDISICEFHRSHSVRRRLRRGYRRVSCIPLPRQRSVAACGLYRRCISVFVVPRLCCGLPEYLSRGFTKHFHHGIFRNLLRRMPEKKERSLFAARNHGPMGQSTWWLFAGSYYCWCFLRRSFAQTRLGQFQNFWPGGRRLLPCYTHQSPRMAHL